MQKKLLISNQHGAWVMALMPFIYALWKAPFVWQSVSLLFGWIALYLMTYPFLSLFKGKNLAFYGKWTGIYGGVALAFFLPAWCYNTHILYVGLMMLPFVAVSIYYTKTRNERALCNDFSAIFIFAIMGMGAYYFTTNTMDTTLWQIGLYPSLFFIATTLYVKSVLRERKNAHYLYASLGVHGVILAFFAHQSLWLGVGFLPSVLRACIVPKLKLTVKQVGMMEFATSFWFLFFLLMA